MCEFRSSGRNLYSTRSVGKNMGRANDHGSRPTTVHITSQPRPLKTHMQLRNCQGFLSATSRRPKQKPIFNRKKGPFIVVGAEAQK